MLKVEGHQDLYREESTGAILNLSSDYDKYIHNRNLRMKQAQELETLKSDVVEIKQMMSLILDKLNTKG
jgi:hypothetical protein